MVDGVEIGRCGGWVMWTLWRQNQKVDDVELGQMDDVELGQMDDVEAGSKYGRCGAGSVG